MGDELDKGHQSGTKVDDRRNQLSDAVDEWDVSKDEGDEMDEDGSDVGDESDKGY